MKVICTPKAVSQDGIAGEKIEFSLYEYGADKNKGTIGAAIRDIIIHHKYQVDQKAWDLLSIALAVIATDTSVKRNKSPDGWTRQLELTIAVTEPDFWTSQLPQLTQLLRYLTTDLWTMEFVAGGTPAPLPQNPIIPDEDCVSLLSGGLDSLVGVLDLVARHQRKPFVVSQVAQGDKTTQSYFASNIGNGLRHLQLNHNVHYAGGHERSQRARSFIFLAYGILAATTLKRYQEGHRVPLFICENGFISINPPLTPARLGSLSTRTTHPIFIQQVQRLLDTTGLRVKIENPYQFFTKGEMLQQCENQLFLRDNAFRATSCGRFARNGYTHCGRCIPCLVRRAAIQAWGQNDNTAYVNQNLALKGNIQFDDVRSVAMAVAEVKTEGLDEWIGTSLSSTLMGDVSSYKDTIRRSMVELENFLNAMGIM